MIECGALSERMPAVALNQDQWSSEERQHIQHCADCAVEWNVVGQGVALGSYTSANLDAQAERLLGRLRSESTTNTIAFPKRTWRWGVPILAAAAASVALLIWAPQHPGTISLGEDGSVAADTTLFPELLQLSETQLQAVLKSMEEGANDEWVAPSPRLGDLSTDQLKALLREVEGGL